jgi:hypothetical protein
MYVHVCTRTCANVSIHSHIHVYVHLMIMAVLKFGYIVSTMWCHPEYRGKYVMITDSMICIGFELWRLVLQPLLPMLRDSADVQGTGTGREAAEGQLLLQL